MKIEIAEPPMIEEIDAAFGCRGQAILYAWGDTIYNPTGFTVPDYLKAHEAVHGQHQNGSVEAWWRKYIADAEFRYEQELAAHREEFRVQAAKLRDRNARERLLMRTASRLVAPLYRFNGRKLLEARKELCQ